MDEPGTLQPPSNATSPPKADARVTGKIRDLIATILYNGFPVAAKFKAGISVTGTTTLATTLTGYLKGASGVVSAQAVPIPQADGGTNQITLSGAAFPGSPVTNQIFYRTDQRCWYTWDGAVWRVVGVEQVTQQDSGGIGQTISLVAYTAITGSSFTMTTLGTGVVSVAAQVRCNVAAGGTLLVRATAGGTVMATQAVLGPLGGDTTISVQGGILRNAGALTCQLEAALVGAGPPNGNILGAVGVWRNERA